MKLTAREFDIDFPRRPLVMGIVNVNDDSFSGDGTLDLAEALALAEQMVAEGADVIDVGAESARTNREAIGIDEEVCRLRDFITEFLRRRQNFARWDEAQLSVPLLSINTWRPEVAEQILPLGGEILNDMGGLPDLRNAEHCAHHGASLLIMHTVGAPKEPHLGEAYPDIMATLDAFFEDRIAAAMSVGVATEQILLDPGIDFAKQRNDNLAIYSKLEKLTRFGRPILLPVSRKTVIGDVLGIADPSDRDAGTLACVVAGYLRGATIFRVHNVDAVAKSLKVVHAIETAT